MKRKRRGNVFFTAVAVAVLITGVAPAAASTGEGNRPSAWAQSADRAPANSTPTLSDDIRAPEGGGTELLLGLGMVALAGLVLVFGLTYGRRQERALGVTGSPRIRARLL